MDLQIKNKVQKFIHRIKIGCYPIYVDNYPVEFESEVQRAVELKRKGNYDEAINIYLEYFFKANCAYTELMSYLYKVLLSAEELFDAEIVIKYAENTLKLRIGEKAPLVLFSGGPVVGYTEWKQTQYRQELINACLQAFYYNNYNALLMHIRAMSGNPLWMFSKAKNDIRQDISDIILCLPDDIKKQYE